MFFRPEADARYEGDVIGDSMPDTASCDIGVDTTRLESRVGVVKALEARDGLVCRGRWVMVGEGGPARRATALSLTVTIP